MSKIFKNSEILSGTDHSDEQQYVPAKIRTRRRTILKNSEKVLSTLNTKKIQEEIKTIRRKGQKRHAQDTNASTSTGNCVKKNKNQ